jgi:putative tryptophan/tyrosine transport system substrate-binding protein
VQTQKSKTVNLLIALFAMLLPSPYLAEAQQPKRIPRIGFLAPGSPSSDSPRVDPFRQGLQELGYTEGQNIVIELRFAEGKSERLPALVAELIQLKVDVIVLSGTPAAQVAKRATTTIPIVMGTSADPVGTELVASLARPGGNVTGLSTLGSDLSGKRLELLKEVVPGVSRIAVLYNPTNQSVPALLKETKIAAQSLGVQVQFLEARAPNELNKVFVAIKERPSALMVVPDPMLFAQRKRLSDLAGENRLPTMAEWEEFVQAGGLMSYGPSFREMFRRAATYVDKILKGRTPADLPVEQPTKFEFVINLKTAKQIGLTIPQWVLMRADRVIK